MKKTTILLAMATLWPMLAATAQTYTLKGTITDQQKNPLIGATITAGKSSTSTTENGNFNLKVTPATGTLTVSYLGYLSQTISYDSARPLNIILAEDPSTLANVDINTGYYSVSQKLSTGSISSVKAAAIEKQPVANPLQALQGRIPGAYITQSSGLPGANINLQIRGRNSIDADGSPLYLVDGIPFPTQSLTNTLTVGIYGTAGASPFNTISPDDIASIEILKDADATAIYGSRGANGVVLITTKKGKSGKTSIDFSTSQGISKLARQLPLMDTQQYLQMRTQAIILDNTTIKPTDYDLNGTWEKERYTNWQKELIGGSALFSTSRLSISGGSENTTFLLSTSYNRQGTVYRGDQHYGRGSAHFSANHSSSDKKFSANLSTIYSSDNSDWINSDFTTRALILSPNAPALYNPDGSLNWQGSTWTNPLRELERKYLAQNNSLLLSAQLSYRPLTGLEFKASLGYGDQRLSDKSYTPASYYDPAENRNASSSLTDFNTSSQRSWNIEPQASYTRKIGSGNLSLLTGLTFSQQQREQLLLRGTGFASDALIENIRAATTSSIRGYSSSLYRYAGIYARANYVMKDRYILNLTARRDASSRFGTGNRSANFGSIAAAYIFSEERLIKENLPFLSHGKLRATYGTSGNDQIGDYEYLNTYESSAVYNGVSALYPLRLFNPGFGWETSAKTELAVDLGFFKDRIRMALSYYRNRSSSQLLNYPLASATGFLSVRMNLPATVQNTGVELEISSTNLKAGKLKWNSSVNLTIPRNRLVSFPGLSGSSYASSYVIGRPLNIVKTYHLLGVDPQTGLYTFADENRDGLITSADDKRTIMERGQRMYGGLDNSLSYKNLELSFLFQFVKQRSSSYNSQNANAAGRAFNQPAAYAGQFWNAPGQIATQQRLTSGSTTSVITALNNYSASDAAIEDSSFIRLKNVSLAYRNTNLLKGKTLRFFAQGQNLLTFTGYFGLDPEAASLSLPPLRTITLGAQLIL